MMLAAAMVIQVMQHYRALAMVLAAPGKPRDFMVELFDQTLLVSGDDVHRNALTRH